MEFEIGKTRWILIEGRVDLQEEWIAMVFEAIVG